MHAVGVFASGTTLLVIGAGIGLVSYAAILALLRTEQEDREFLRSAVPT